MSRPSSSVPNQCADDGGPRRAGKLIDAGSRGAIHGANRAKITKITTNTTPAAASGLWRAFPARRRRNEMAALDMNSLQLPYLEPKIPVMMNQFEIGVIHGDQADVVGACSQRSSRRNANDAGCRRQKPLAGRMFPISRLMP